MIKIYKPITHNFWEQIKKTIKTIKTILEQDIPYEDKVNNLYESCKIENYIFLKDIDEREFERLKPYSEYSEERLIGNIAIYENGDVYVVNGDDLIKIDTFLIVDGNEYPITNNEGNILLDVHFPNIIEGCYVETTFTLNEIFEFKSIREAYENAIAYSNIPNNSKIGFLRVTIVSENEGKVYYYDVVSKTWYYAKNEKISSFKETKELVTKSDINTKHNLTIFFIKILFVALFYILFVKLLTSL